MGAHGILKNGYIAALIAVLASVLMSSAAILQPKLLAASVGAAVVVAIASRPRLAIVIIIVLLENMFFILKPEWGIGSRVYTDGALAVVFVMIGISVLERLKNRDGYGQVEWAFSKYMLFFIVMLAAAAVNSMRIYSQPLEMGLRASRSFLILAAYFPLRDIMRDKGIREWTYKLLLYGGLAVCCSYLLQYFLMDKVVVFNMPYIERFGETRLRIEIGIIIMSFFAALSGMAKEEGCFAGLAAIAVFEIVMLTIMIKTRTVVFGLAVSAGFFWFLQKKRPKLLAVYFAALFIFVNGFYMKDSLVSNLYKLTVDEISSGTGNYDVRVDEMDFYMGQAAKTPVFGRGVLNELHPSSREALGVRQRFFLSDIGVFAFFFYFGIVGVAWAGMVLVKAAMLAARAAFEGDSFMLFLFVVYAVATIPTIFIFEGANLSFYMVLAICMCEGELEELGVKPVIQE